MDTKTEISAEVRRRLPTDAVVLVCTDSADAAGHPRKVLICQWMDCSYNWRKAEFCAKTGKYIKDLR